ncbi:hypothetical protein [Haloarcula marina]|uniref:hypothetical protein n=1 Tax=Haloarcula marina TaxID=2961574 RepID=UPI0020B658A1|nr:hypothetical protein [Halomicroarcula marina]
MESSWSNIEERFLEHYEEGEELEGSDRDFLERIQFLENGEISSIGEHYLDSKFIFENGDHKDVLRQEVLNLQEIRELCQSFYGQKTERDKVERFLKSKTDVTNDREVGRILNLLNSLDVVSYSKKTGDVQFTEAEQVEEENQDSYRVTNRTPYSNIKRLRRAIRACEGDLMWIAKHFPKKGFEPLSDEVTGDGFTSVRILCGPDNVTHKMRSDFERFEQEMSNRGVEAELRVMTDGEHLGNLHDRWILSDGASWNVPPVNSLYRNQEAELHKATEEVSFEDWWDEAKDIISEWNDIQKYI